MNTLDDILTTHLFKLDESGQLELVEEQFKKSRQAILHELKTTKEEMDLLDLDLVDDYQTSIVLLEETSDEQFEIWKNQLKLTGRIS
ncbi:hypothetical protein [Streptococcus suis]|uniref:hypothetical protein n=1 Tax=Streptococcus suis TaxID=1307 RepID=UPI0005CE31B6|nr:hypothetical protein [Streptococcus suis]NQI11173.1 hypothetical protein [Streptococcus suis]NQN16465.1 hypothetical protein [Streptococcus suis]CYU46157.1 Uncharacterised protein [Streptococcus suis]HEL2301946.1 hypothetical protein [Streptococcus suis]HEL2511052.1 hypothetical protein [Streptococcus suis]